MDLLGMNRDVADVSLLIIACALPFHMNVVCACGVWTSVAGAPSLPHSSPNIMKPFIPPRTRLLCLAWYQKSFYLNIPSISFTTLTETGR